MIMPRFSRSRLLVGASCVAAATTASATSTTPLTLRLLSMGVAAVVAPNLMPVVVVHAEESSSDDDESSSDDYEVYDGPEDDDDDDDDDGTYCLITNPNGSCRMWSNVQHFVHPHTSDMEFKWASCDAEPYDDANHADFMAVASERSLYQTVGFEENIKVALSNDEVGSYEADDYRSSGDKCLRLDLTLQQCSSYRPHYHEPFVHLSAAYLENVKRVVFVGGGDSMLLHEVLKYKDVEVVLGLELDQKVTRNSFEHFKTQPHFDDPRVQWWFGDGAKSLTMLPRSYFGTFDLVLLDLSETVMSMTVTKGLDVFGAMKLLLGPKGILVKNDFGYFENLSTVFDTCLQLDIGDVTYICDYELVLCASDEVDLLKPSFDHLNGVDTLVYHPQQNDHDHWGPVSDYSKYSTYAKKKECDADADADDDEGEENATKAGVLMIVEAEHVSANLGDAAAVTKAILDPLLKSNFNVLTTIASQPDAATGGIVAVAAMAEGYILAETYPAAGYVGLDVHLWGKFDEHETVRAGILEKLGCGEGDWSSYRIVAGGMGGTESRAADSVAIGPDLSNLDLCGNSAFADKGPKFDAVYGDEEMLGPVIDAALEEATGALFASTRTINAVVFCPDAGVNCRAKDVLEKKLAGVNVDLTTMRACSTEATEEMKNAAYQRGVHVKKWRDDLTSGAKELVMCAKTVSVALREFAKKNNGVNLVVVDAAASSDVAAQAADIWTKSRKQILRKEAVLMVPILDRSDVRRSGFLDSRHNKGVEEPEYYSEIYLTGGQGGGGETKTMSLGLIHDGNAESLKGLLRAAERLNERPEVDAAEIRRITNRGVAKQQPDFDPVTFSWADYDQAPGLEQFYGQQSVGAQTVFQLGIDPKKEKPLAAAMLLEAFTYAVNALDANVKELESFDVGSGALYVALLDGARVVMTWDGAAAVNINIFTRDEDAMHYTSFVAPLLNKLPVAMKIMLKDEQPRGFGKVINKGQVVNHDESPECYDYYKLCERKVEMHGCTAGTAGKEAIWMKENCRFSCGMCDEKKSFASSEL